MVERKKQLLKIIDKTLGEDKWVEKNIEKFERILQNFVIQNTL